MKAKILFFLLLFSLYSFAQSSISGYITLKDSTAKKQNIVLAQLITTINSGKVSKIIASSTIDYNGYFHINKILSEKQQRYYIYVKNIDSSRNTDISSTPFFLANKDSIHFKLGSIPFSDYSTSNASSKEWQKLNALKTKLNVNKPSENTYLSEIRNYSKDSLQILAVKLLSVKELNDRMLLKKDIQLNSAYYLDLLSELKSSTIEPSEYAFLEEKLAVITKQIVEEKYTKSKWIIIVLGSIILGLLAFVYSLKNRKKTIDTTALSKQESTVRNLILLGKSNKEIANELFISLSTVKTHITNIYHKLNVSSRSELSLKFKN